MNKKLEYVLGTNLPLYMVFVNWALTYSSMVLAYLISALISGHMTNIEGDIPNIIGLLAFIMYFNFIMSEAKDNKAFPFHERKPRKKK